MVQVHLSQPEKVSSSTCFFYYITPFNAKALASETCIRAKALLANIKQVFIDEMQDYDAITIKLLKIIFPKAIFTIVGDYGQNLLFASNNKQAVERYFDNAEFYNLTTNYRSNYKISQYACKILGKEYKSNVIREGEAPIIKQTNTFEENIKEIKSLIKSLVNQNKKVAIICKTIAEVENYKKYLTDCYVLNQNDNIIEINKPILTSVFYAKGLEFDAIILPNVNLQNYNTEVDKNILYVATTRTLHNLYIFHIGEKSKLIDF